MAQNNGMDTTDVKQLFRALEDRRDLRMQMKIEKEYMLRDLNAIKERVNSELNHNNIMKGKLEELKDMTEQEKKKLETISSLRSTLAKGSLTKVISFALETVQKYKNTTLAKKREFEKKLKLHIEDFTKKRPYVLKCQEKENQFDDLQQQLQNLREEKNIFIKRGEKEKQINAILFQQNVVEMARHVLKYYSIVYKSRNPNKATQRAVPSKPMLKTTMPKQVREKTSEPMQDTDQNMSDPSGCPKEQQSSGSNVDDEANIYDRNSVKGGGMKLKKTVEKKDQARHERSNEVVNKEQPKMVSKPQSFLNRQKSKEGSQEKEMRSSVKHPISSASSLKVPVKVSSQKPEKPRKAKVSFVDPKPTSSASFKMDAFEADEGFSSFKVSSTNVDMFSEDENDIQINDNEEEDDIQMNDDEQEQMRKMNKSPSLSEGIDDDQISNWTSLEVPTGNLGDNNKCSNSPTSKASSFEFDFQSMEGQLPKNGNNSKSTDNDPFSFGDQEMEDFFKNH